MRHLRGARRRRAEHAAPAAVQRHRDDRGGPLDAAGAGLRPRRRSRPTREQQQACVEPVARHATASTGATTRCTTRRPRAPTRPTPTGRRARSSSARWSRRINGAGLRVVMDVVYNHTPAAGQDPKSILDRIVPGYYHRLDPPTGAVETSTCCANTATEHRDDGEADGRLGRHVGARSTRSTASASTSWATTRRPTCSRCARALDALTLQARRRRRQAHLPLRRGLELRRGRRTTRASSRPRQLNMAGTGIGTFNDRLRDAVRGGGPFDADPRIQGFATGLFTDPNGVAGQRHAGRAARAAAALPGPDQGRAGRQPARLHVRRPHRRDGHRRARSTTTASRPATPPTRARRSPTSTRTTTRRCSTRSQYKLPHGHVDGRPRADEHASRWPPPRSRRARRSGTPAPTCCAPSRSTATASTRATGSTGSTGPADESTWGSGLPPAADNESQVAVHAAAARRPGARAARRPTSARRATAPRSCCGSASPRRCSGSAARARSSSA